MDYIFYLAISHTESNLALMTHCQQQQQNNKYWHFSLQKALRPDSERITIKRTTCSGVMASEVDLFSNKE